MPYVNRIQRIPTHGFFGAIVRAYGAHTLYQYKYSLIAEDGGFVAAWNKQAAIEACRVYGASCYTHRESGRTFRIKE